MRSILVAALLCAVATASYAGQVKMFAGARFDPKSWAKLESFDVRTLSKTRTLNAQVGRLVELHFQFRSVKIRDLKPNWYQSAVWQAAPQGTRGFVSVPV